MDFRDDFIQSLICLVSSMSEVQMLNHWLLRWGISSPVSFSYGSGKRSFSYGFRGGQHGQVPQEPTSRYGQPSEIDGCSKLGRVSFREALSPQLQGQAVLHQPEGWGWVPETRQPVSLFLHDVMLPIQNFIGYMT